MKPSGTASPGRAKLRRLGVDLPLFPLTAVGSFPRPPALAEARARWHLGRLLPTELEALEKRAVEQWVRAQESAGLDVLVDGEFYRGHMVGFFAERMPGFYPGGWVRVSGNRYQRKPVIVGEVRWPGPMTVNWWRFAQSLTSKPMKAVLTGPYTLAARSFDEYYPSRSAACLALAMVVRKEAEALVEAGAKILQLDEPELPARPADLPFAREALQRVTEGLPAYFVLHMCKGGFEAIYPAMLRLPVDNIDLEMTGSHERFLPLLREHPFGKDFSLGVVDSHDPVVEPAALVRRRLEKARRCLPPDRLWVDPDCGLRALTPDAARRKLAVMSQAVQGLRPVSTPRHRPR
jgi:5-methyltetrahydropteroyltriglutamate--homocysteine methyltransferase